MQPLNDNKRLKLAKTTIKKQPRAYSPSSSSDVQITRNSIMIKDQRLNRKKKGFKYDYINKPQGVKQEIMTLLLNVKHFYFYLIYFKVYDA